MKISSYALAMLQRGINKYYSDVRVYINDSFESEIVTATVDVSVSDMDVEKMLEVSHQLKIVAEACKQINELKLEKDYESKFNEEQRKIIAERADLICKHGAFTETFIKLMCDFEF